MKIGIAGPISLNLLRDLVKDGSSMNDGYSFPMTSHLVIELLQRGHEVVVFALDPETEKPHTHTGSDLTIHVCPYRPRGRDRAKDFFRREREYLERAMASEQCSVIHAHWSYEFALAALKSGTPALITMHDWAPTILAMHRDAYRTVRLLMSFAVVAKGSTFTANSPYVAGKLKRWRPSLSIPVIPNFVGPAFFKEGPRAPGERLVIGSINNGFDKRKNVHSLLRAFGEIRLELPEAQLELAGPGYEDDGPARRWSQSRGLTDRVTFKGALASADVVQFLADINLYVHPSREESFGISIAEAMAARVPVIAGGRSGAVPWVLGGGEAGVLVDVTSPEEIGRAVLRLHADRRRWEELSKAGFERAFKSFRASRVVRLYENQYEAVAALADSSR